MNIERALERTVEALDRFGAEYALIGALAVGARSEPRFTRDIDLAVAVPSDSDAERLVHFLLESGYKTHEVFEREPTGELSIVCLKHPDFGDIIVDLLVRASGIESEVVTAASDVEVFPGMIVAVATIADLLALKTLSREDTNRPQDKLDLARLLEKASDQDRADAISRLRLISERGFHRDRDLTAEFAALVRERG